MMAGKGKVRGVFSVWMAALALCSLWACSSGNSTDVPEKVTEAESAATDDLVEPLAVKEETGNVQASEEQKDDKQVSKKRQGDKRVSEEQEAGEQAGEDLDVIEPDAADDDWYRKGNVYTGDNGHRLEVFFDDEGMLEFAVDGLSLYYTTVDHYQRENNWRIYTCDDGTAIVYYPGEPAHLEISDGDYAGLYQEGGDKVK